MINPIKTIVAVITLLLPLLFPESREAVPQAFPSDAAPSDSLLLFSILIKALKVLIRLLAERLFGWLGILS